MSGAPETAFVIAHYGPAPFVLDEPAFRCWLAVDADRVEGLIPGSHDAQPASDLVALFDAAREADVLTEDIVLFGTTSGLAPAWSRSPGAAGLSCSTPFLGGSSGGGRVRRWRCGHSRGQHHHPDGCVQGRGAGLGDQRRPGGRGSPRLR